MLLYYQKILKKTIKENYLLHFFFSLTFSSKKEGEGDGKSFQIQFDTVVFRNLNQNQWFNVRRGSSVRMGHRFKDKLLFCTLEPNSLYREVRYDSAKRNNV